MTRPRQPYATVRTRADWRGLVDLALACVGDAERADVGQAQAWDDNRERRRMDLSRKVAQATTDQLEREAGAVTGDMARALVRIGRAWSRRETSGVTRAELTPSLKSVAGWVDGRLHALATDEFQRAHAGRPEVA